MDSTRLKDKVAIVTGASSGIGEATVIRFVQEGAKVMAAGRSGRHHELANLYPDRVVAVDCDVTIPEQVEEAVRICVSQFGRLDIVVNNAGVTGEIGRVHEYSIDVWDKVLDANLKGPFLVMRAAIPVMLQNGGGSIINIASVGSFVYAGGSTAYAPSKGGLLMLTKQAAIEYAKDDIRVNAVCPGIIRTPILDGAPVGLDTLASFVPVERLGDSGDITPFIAYLASDESRYATGSSFLIDGGLTSV